MTGNIVTQDQPFEERRTRGKFKLNSEDLLHLSKSLEHASRLARTSTNVFEIYSAQKHVTNLIEKIATKHDFTASQLAEFDRMTGLITVVDSAKTGLTRAEMKRRKNLKKQLADQVKKRKK